ncbi:MAG: ferrous iron transport protein A [Mailhella sp.]|nr:ferrous iron transport protein A [Mailhella sp.]
MTLNDIHTTTECRVARVIADGVLGQRLSDMGFCPGTNVLFVRRAPMNDPVHVQLGSYHVVLRAAEADAIEVETLQ